MKRSMLFLLLLLFFPTLVWSGTERYDVPIGDAPIRGPSNAPVTIIEFLDFQ